VLLNPWCSASSVSQDHRSVAIEQQAWLSLLTHLLKRLFLYQNKDKNLAWKKIIKPNCNTKRKMNRHMMPTEWRIIIGIFQETLQESQTSMVFLKK